MTACVFVLVVKGVFVVADGGKGVADKLDVVSFLFFLGVFDCFVAISMPFLTSISCCLNSSTFTV